MTTDKKSPLCDRAVLAYKIIQNNVADQETLNGLAITPSSDDSEFRSFLREIDPEVYHLTVAMDRLVELNFSTDAMTALLKYRSL